MALDYAAILETEYVVARSDVTGKMSPRTSKSKSPKRKRTGTTLREVLERASLHLDAGRFGEAEALCRRTLEVRPEQPHALYLLGLSIHRGRRDPDGLPFVDRALAAKPDFAEAHCGRGLLLQETGRSVDALAAYRRALELQPSLVMAHRGLAACHAARGEIEDALAAYARAIELAPDSVSLLAESAALLRRVGRAEAALRIVANAADRSPDSPDVQGLLAQELHHQGRLDESVAAHRRTIELAPDVAIAHTNLGVTLQARGDLDGAAASHAHAATLDPRNARAQHNRALVCMEQNRLDEAEEAFSHALAADPRDPDLHWDHALSLLRAGRLREGWEEFEWRWSAPGFGSSPRHTNIPLWDGSALDGRRLLVHAEQGLGDTIQFCRYLPMLRRPGAEIVFECPPPLSRLMQSLDGVGAIVHRDQSAGAVDVQVPLLSLPRLFGTTTRSIPAAVPYLAAAEPDRERWARELESIGGRRRVGFVWAGSATHRNDAQRSMPVHHVERLLSDVDLRGFSLQVEGSEVPSEMVDLGGRLSDFAETAAVVANLDLVVTVDTAVAHLAGALGRPVWVVLPFAPDWRWMLEREDSPWYPTMRLFRQANRGDWDDVLTRLREAFAALAAD